MRCYPDRLGCKQGRYGDKQARTPKQTTAYSSSICGRLHSSLFLPIITEHSGRELIPISKRPLSEEEMEWVRQSLSSGKAFVEFRLPQLFAVSKCPWGNCRTIGVEPV